MNPIISFKQVSYSPPNLSFILSDDKIDKILNGISLEIFSGEIIGIVGESGSGKTTLAKLIAGAIKPTEGEINTNLKNDSGNGAQILFQNSDELINPLRKVKNLLREVYTKEETLIEVCHLLDISADLLNNFGNQLSGGERQRVGLARILSANPEVLILDEPFSAQDQKSRESFLQIFNEINSRFNTSIVCISHNINIIKGLAQRIIVLYGGKIMEHGSTKDIFYSTCHPYTKFLMDAEDYSLSHEDFRKNSIFEETTKGCPYFRCANRSSRCNESIEEIKSEGMVTYCNHPIQTEKEINK